MDFKEIQELVRLMNKSDLSELRIEKENFKITLKKDGHQKAELHTVQYAAPVIAQHHAAPLQAAEPAATAHREEEAPAKKGAEQQKENLHTIKSPMIGTFYRATGPDKDPFVKVGDVVKSGSVLCIIEAMKLFNEIESEVAGKIVKVLIEDASPVEYDQPLFIVDTSEI